MILFDYVYYLFAKLYRRSKDERESDTWKISGIAIVYGTLALFLMAWGFLLSHFFNYPNLVNPVSGIILIVFLMIFFHVRYEKWMTFEKVQRKIRSLSIKQIILLRIITFIYLMIAIPGFFLATAYFGKLGQG